jgi:hypothetical protein
MRQLQEQADELRRVIRRWAGHSEVRSRRRHELVVEDDTQQ